MRPVLIFLPLPSQDLLDELNKRAMEQVKNSRIRSTAVIDIHHVMLNESRLFNEVLTLPPSSIPPVAFELSKQRTVVLVTDQLRRSDYGLTWAGHISNNPTGSGLFRADPKARTISGQIRIGGTLYEIRPGEEGSYAIFTIDTAKLPPDHSKSWNTRDPQKRVPRDLFPDSSGHLSLALFPFVIDVMVLYTQNAINSDSGYDIASHVCDAMTQLENSLLASGVVNAKARLVHHEVMQFTESGSLESDLRTVLSDQAGSAHVKRRTHGADLVSIWVGDGDECGRAEAIVQPGGSGALAFSFVRRNCATAGFSFSHELGHLMGTYHDRFDAEAADDTRRIYGYTLPEKNWRTIMGNDRVDCRPSCARVNYWSNPANSYPPPPNLGDPMGRRDDAPRTDCTNRKADPTLGEKCDGPANNVVTLNNNAEAVSKFSSTGAVGNIACGRNDIAPPGAPTGLRTR